jgi:ArsR family transcriptional regulator
MYLPIHRRLYGDKVFKEFFNSYTYMHSPWKALSDDSRRKMLLLLRQSDMYPNQIAKHFDMTFAAVSTHLRILRDAELVKEKREGQRVRYSLSKEKSAEIKEFFEGMWGIKLDSLKEFVENEEMKRRRKDKRLRSVMD